MRWKACSSTVAYVIALLNEQVLEVIFQYLDANWEKTLERVNDYPGSPYPDGIREKDKLFFDL